MGSSASLKGGYSTLFIQQEVFVLIRSQQQKQVFERKMWLILQ